MATDTSPGAEPDVVHSQEHHPGPREYVKIAVFLAVVTAVEVAIYYMQALRGVLVPMLLGLSALKFVLVALWFMHLKFDSRIFRRLFVTGISLAVVVYAVVLLTFGLLLR